MATAFLFYFAVFNSSQKKSTLANILKESIGKEISIKQDTATLIAGSFTNKSSSNYTIIHYIDSIGCTRCNLKLESWDQLIQELNKISSNHISLWFITNTRNPRILQTLFGSKYQYPVIDITNNTSNNLREILSNRKLSTFLLDKNNKIIMLGNPLKNHNIKNEYYRLILSNN